MRVSWKWLSEMLDLSYFGNHAKITEIYTQRGLEVEEIHRLDAGFEHVITAQILERNPHPQADRLSLCKVTIGSGEPLQIVCGAQNMKAGDKVALAQIGALLPNGLKIEKSKIRGVESFGMLCSEEELKLKDKAEGILILPASTQLGKPLASILRRDDTILQFKLTANRGDCMSHYGMARELGAALGQRPKRKELKELDWASLSSKCPIEIKLEAGELSPQFFGVYIEGVKIGPSPEWMVSRLDSVGVRSINNVVDASNLLLAELGHPTHAYDADQIQGKVIGVRLSKDGEELPLLDGQTVKLGGTELVIFDGKRSVGLAGVMGGGNSEVQPTTTRLFLEVAEFDPVRIRRAAFKHQRRSEAAQRFEKGIDPAALGYVTTRLAQLITELAGGKIVGARVARLPSREPKALLRCREVEVKPSYFETFLGMDVSETQAEKVLADHDCKVTRGPTWKVAVPSYRLDLGTKEDLAEEIARSLGYDKIRATVPPLTSAPQSMQSAVSAAALGLKDRAKDALAALGLSETLNYGFTSRAWLAKFGYTSAVTLMNPLSEECEAMTPSLLPGLVQNAQGTWRKHFGSEIPAVRLFELRPTFQFHGQGGIRSISELETGVEERWKLSLLISGGRVASGLKQDQVAFDFYDLKAIIEGLFSALGTKGVRIQPLTSGRGDAVLTQLFHPGKSAEILAGKGVAGYFGMLHPGKARELKLDADVWVCEMDWDAIAKLSRPIFSSSPFKMWSQFPGMERDFALVVKDVVTAEKIVQTALKVGKPLIKTARVFDVYRGAQVGAGLASVAVRVVFGDDTRVLQEAETEAACAKLVEAWKKELGAELRA